MRPARDGFRYRERCGRRYLLADPPDRVLDPDERELYRIAAMHDQIERERQRKSRGEY